MLWDSDYETGVREIDEHNHDLVGHIEAMMNPDNNRSRYERLVNFEQAAEKYFETEQKLHRECGYEHAERHKFIHKKYLMRLRRMKKNFVENGPTLQNEMIFIKDVLEALKKHIIDHDKVFATYYNAGVENAEAL
jgi:hemerythrin-like metal-binding protein